MRATALLCWLAFIPALADPPPTSLSLRFQANANRLSPEAISQLDRLAGLMHGDTDLRLTVAMPSQHDPRRNRLLAARQAELNRQFAARAIFAEFLTDLRAADDDGLTLTLRPVALDPPIVATNLPLVPPTAATAVQPVAIAESPSPLWHAEPGPSLRAMLGDWADQAGWTMIWQSSYDYPVQAAAQLQGDFAAMVPHLLGGFSEATPPPRARIFSGNHVVIIE